MGVTVSARAFGRDVGFYVRRARSSPVAVTYHGRIEAYILSPEAYAEILRGQVVREDGHQAAVARMEAMMRAGRV
jgi:PHD/YefM family antitoxin component YafN of YafNO toxin-antitoxin module